MPASFESLKSVLIQQIISPVVWVLIFAALVYFLWGMTAFIYKGSSPDARIKGQQHMLWGVVGLAIMISVFGIMHFIFGTVTAIGGNKGINNTTVNEPGIDKGFGN